MQIYKTTNLINGRFYIGKQIDDDIEYLGSGKILRLAIKKYGKDNFKKEILEICNSDELDEREKYWINYYNAADGNDGYNITTGGNGGDVMRNNPDRDIIREKISNTLKCHSVSEETRIKMSNSKKGKKFSESHKSALSKNHVGMTGKKHSDETKKILSEKNKGKKMPEDSKLKISAALKGMTGSFTGKKHSTKSKRKMSESHKKKGEIK